MKRAELIEKWLKALESGEYHQAQGALSVNYGEWNQSFCCLGVACVVAKNNGIEKVTDRIIESQTALPSLLAKRLGISNLGTFIKSIRYRGRTYSDLTQLNDGGVRFKTIARIIREQLAAKNFKKP